MEGALLNPWLSPKDQVLGGLKGGMLAKQGPCPHREPVREPLTEARLDLDHS